MYSIEVGPVDIWTVCFSPDDKYIVSGSHAGKIHLYSAENGKQEQILDTRGGKFTFSVAYVRKKLFSNQSNQRKLKLIINLSKNELF
jgi:WD40 repeat protein